MSQSIENRFNDYLGLEVTDVTDEGCTVMLKVRPEHYNTMEGVVHGGVTYTMADVAMGHGAAPHKDGIQQCVTVECKINYLSPARGTMLKAVSKVLKRGRKLIITEALITSEDGTLVAVALGTYARVNTK